MSQMRVYELAKEMNMPAKQLLQKMRQAGISAPDNFFELSKEQVSLVKKMAQTPKGSVAGSKPIRSSQRRVISTRKKRKTTEEVKETTTTESTETSKTSVAKTSQVITVSTKSRLDEDGERPRRRVRRNKKVHDSGAESKAAKKPDKSEDKSTPEIPQKQEPESEPHAASSSKKTVPATSGTSGKTQAPKKKRGTERKSKSEMWASETKKKSPPETQGKLAAEKQTPGPKNKTAAPGTTFAETVVSKDKIPAEPEKKSKKTKVTYKRLSWRDDNDVPLRGKNPRRHDGGKSRRSTQKDYLNRDEGRPRRRKRERSRERRRKEQERIAVPSTPKHVFNPRKKSIRIGNQVGVGELAGLIGIKVPEILKKLMPLGIMATINETISGETAELVAADFDVTVELEAFKLEDMLKEEQPDQAELENRAPIVTVMGHVDHGKTSLLDKIRETRVASGEAGGITQHIGAYHLEVGGNQITFLDTPGHKAFTAMRARGADVTDIVVLVVAADDKVQPQTVEAIRHARAADVPIIVAVNKIDRPEADPNRIQQELLAHELIPEELGGSTIFVKVSAKMGSGIDELLEMLHLQAEVLELKSTPKGQARGTIIESRVRKGQGPVGTVLVQRGTLKIGDYFVMGDTHGRIRSMCNERGETIIKASPSIPVEISGLSNVPEVGEQFVVLEDERKARRIAEERGHKLRAETIRKQQKTGLDNLFSRMEEGRSTELRLILKGDVQGSVEALKSSLEQLGDQRISLRFLLCAVGDITETDVTLASASDAIIVGFNVQMDAQAKEVRSREGVDVRLYEVIYNALDDVKAAMEGLLEPEIREEILGHCEVRQIFSSGKSGVVFGGLVTDGKILRNCLSRVLRNGDKVYEGTLVSLKHFKEDVPEVLQNYECGMVLDFPEIADGDVVEAYEQIEESARL